MYSYQSYQQSYQHYPQRVLIINPHYYKNKEKSTKNYFLRRQRKK